MHLLLLPFYLNGIDMLFNGALVGTPCDTPALTVCGDSRKEFNLPVCVAELVMAQDYQSLGKFKLFYQTR